MQTINTNPAQGITAVAGSAYFSLGSPLWIQRTEGPFAKYTYSYAPPGHGWDDGEMATMNMARWGNNPKDEWYSASMRLNMALGFGAYEQSLKVGKGSGVTTTFYLCEENAVQLQEIDFEFSGHCYKPGEHCDKPVEQCDKPGEHCGTASAWTNVWWKEKQHEEATLLWPVSKPPSPMPDTTQGWGKSVYRYKIDWERDVVKWSVDLTGTGNSYQVIRSQEMSAIGADYDEGLCYPFISFWTGWTPDGSPFLKGEDATGKCGDSGACYQAFYFQSLKFTPSSRNQITRIGS
jgi:hypothetical protein